MVHEMLVALHSAWPRPDHFFSYPAVIIVIILTKRCTRRKTCTVQYNRSWSALAHVLCMVLFIHVYYDYGDCWKLLLFQQAQDCADNAASVTLSTLRPATRATVMVLQSLF